MTKERLKWIALAAWALLMGILAAVYGKRTGSVLRAALEAHNAKTKILEAEMELERQRFQNAEKEKVDASKARLLVLESKLAEAKAKRTELADESGDLPGLSDADLAKYDNRRRAAARSG